MLRISFFRFNATYGKYSRKPLTKVSIYDIKVTMKNIGKEIKKLMKKRGVSGYKIAGALGILPESLYRSLSDGGNPEWKTIRAILDYLRYDVKFVKGKEVKKSKPKPPKIGRKEK